MKTKNFIFYSLAIVSVYSIVSCGVTQCDTENAQVISKNDSIETVEVKNDCKKSILVKKFQRLKVGPDSFLMNGLYEEYYPNGSLKMLAFFKNGMQDSICFINYPNGHAHFQSYKSDGQLAGPQYEYYPDGMLKKVDFNVDDSTKYFGVFYDNYGKIIETKGSPCKIFAKPGYNERKVGDVVSIFNDIPILNRTKVILNIRFSKQSHIICDTNMKNFYHVGNRTVSLFIQRVNEPGVYDFISHIRLIDSVDNHVIAEDSLIRQITVR